MEELKYFVHPNALVETTTIGHGSRIWAFAHVQKNVKIGEDCNVGDHSFIESGVEIGDAVTIKNGVSIWEGVTIEDNVFIGPNAVFTNDLRPRSKVYHRDVLTTHIARGASIGANATIIAGNQIGEYAMVGAGAVVTRDVKAFELVTGVPARNAGYVSRLGNTLVFVDGLAIDGDDRYAVNDNTVSLIS